MLLRHLFEDTSITTLYRGDSSNIDSFDRNHNRRSFGLLFGHGIYLTDNEQVANEYTLAGAYSRDDTGNILFLNERESREDAIRDYIAYVMTKRLGREEKYEACKQLYITASYAAIASLDRFSDEYRVAREDANKAFKEDWKKQFIVLVKQAKALIKKELPTLKLVKVGRGWQIVRNNHTGILSKFEFPTSYLDQCLHGDTPLPNKALKALSEFFYSVLGDKEADFRDFEGNWYQFDKWIEIFKTDGSRYAWSERKIGGKGVNPSLDEIMNGTHCGTSFLQDRDRWEAIIAKLESSGYVGIMFGGGVSTTGFLRGGGATAHTSYVLWDSDYVNSCRADSSPGSLDSHDLDVSLVTPSKMNRWTKYDA